MRTEMFAVFTALIALPFIVSSAHATPTFVDTMGGANGNERCLIGEGEFGNNLCTDGGTFGDQQSIVDLIIEDINAVENASLTWQRVVDPADNLFTFLSNADTATSVRGRARYAGYYNKFGATVGGTYTDLLCAPLSKNKVLLRGSVGSFVAIDLGLTSGQSWKPTLKAGDGNTYTSDPSDNFNALDHMVAFKTVDPVNATESDGFSAFRYIVGFEDLPDLGDEDYNDYVVEIFFSAVESSVPEPTPLDVGQTSVPEPTTLALLSFGLVGLGALRRRRRA